MDYSSPKVVVIDCLGLATERKTSEKFEYVHLSLDTFPISLTKLKAVFDLMNDPEVERLLDEGSIDESKEKRTKLGILWDYSVYHVRWEGIGKTDFKQDNTKEYGAESRIQIAEPGQVSENKGLKLEDETVAMEYLEKMIESCQKRGIEVVLVFLPYPIDNAENWKPVNTFADIAEKYKVRYINFFDEDIVDHSTDCYDKNSHLNPSGAWKVTDYLGSYLRKNYELADHRDDEAYDYCNEDFESYSEMKDKRLSDISDLNTYLMLLEDKRYGYIMDVGDPTVFEDSVTRNLLKNKGFDIDSINENTRHLIVYDKKNYVINEAVSGNGIYGGDSKLNLLYKEDGNFSAYDKENELFSLKAESLELSEDRMVVYAIDIETGEIANKSIFMIKKPLEIEERYPNDKGITIMSSKAARVSE